MKIEKSCGIRKAGQATTENLCDYPTSSLNAKYHGEPSKSSLEIQKGRDYLCASKKRKRGENGFVRSKANIKYEKKTVRFLPDPSKNSLGVQTRSSHQPAKQSEIIKENVSSFSKTKPTAKSSAKILGGPSSEGLASRTSSQEGTVIGFSSYHAAKQSKRKENVSRHPKILGEPSSEGLASRTTSQEGTIVGSSYGVQTRRSYHAAKQFKREEIFSSHPKTKPSVKSGAKILGESSSKGLASHTTSREGTANISSEELEMIRRASFIDSKLAECARRLEEILESLLVCGICMDWKFRPEMFKSRCSHSFCLSCIGKHVSANVRDNIIKVKCPDLTCNVLLEPQNCRSFVPKQVVDRWELVLCESAIGSDKIYCPFKDCSAVLLVEDGQKGVTSAECPHCHRLFCARCQVPWHAGSECKSEAQRMDTKFVELAQKEKWQKCPSCKFYVQRSTGCECITCRCGHKFCYICGNNWSFGHLCPTGR